MASPVGGVARTVPIVDDANAGVEGHDSDDSRREPLRPVAGVEQRRAVPHRASSSASVAASHVLTSLQMRERNRGIHPGPRGAQVRRRATRAGWRTRMWTTLLFGAIASSALIIGAAIGVRFKLPKRVLAMLLAFAAGALITALSFELFEDSYERGGIWLAAIGLFVGAIVFTVLSALLDRWAQPDPGRHRQTSTGEASSSTRMPRPPTDPRLRRPLAGPQGSRSWRRRPLTAFPRASRWASR